MSVQSGKIKSKILFYGKGLVMTIVDKYQKYLTNIYFLLNRVRLYSTFEVFHFSSSIFCLHSQLRVKQTSPALWVEDSDSSVADPDGGEGDVCMPPPPREREKEGEREREREGSRNFLCGKLNLQDCYLCI